MKTINLPPVGTDEQLIDVLGLLPDTRSQEITKTLRRKETLLKNHLPQKDGEEIILNGHRIYNVRYDDYEKNLYYTLTPATYGVGYYYPLRYSNILITRK